MHIVSGTTINGALVYCKLLAQQQCVRGHNVRIVCRAGSWLQTQPLPCPVIESNLARLPSRELRRIASLIRSENIDVVHTHMTRAHAFGTLLKLHVDVPVVKTAHSRSFQVHWKLNDFVIANSKATYDYHRRVNRISASRMETIPCFVDQQRFLECDPKAARRARGQLRWRNGEFIVGIIGQVTPRKGHEFLIRALPEICAGIPQLRLLVLGSFHRREKYARYLRRFLLDHGLQRKSKWIGIRNNVADFLHAIDVCVMPSVEEPLGMVAIESQLAGTPVVASRTGGLAEVVQHGETGLLVPPRCPDSIRDAVLRLARDPALRESLSTSGRDRAIKTFCPDQLTDRVERVYQNLIQAKSKPRAA